MKLPFPPAREKFLVLVIGPEQSSALFLSLAQDRRLVLEKLVKNIDLKKFLGAPTRKLAQKQWEGEPLFKRSRRKVVAVAHPTLATTIPVPLALTREKDLKDAEITLAELENLIAQSMGKLFNQCRSEAAKRLGLDDLDTVLVGAKARSFTVDDHLVMNPVGFTGKKIGLALELTFTGRQLFLDLRELFKAPDEFFFAELPQASLGSLAREQGMPLNLIVAEGGKSSLFVLQKAEDRYPVLYRETFPWDPASFVRAIAEELGVSHGAAEHLYRSYREGKMSDHAARAFKRIVDEPLEALFSAIEKSGLKGHVYMDTPLELPVELPHRHGKATLNAFPLAEALAGARFAGDFSRVRESPALIARHLLPFLESYLDDADPAVNEKLRRRLHWLAE